jgi:putative AlgH/UPF0301 family transcriptional regulator
MSIENMNMNSAEKKYDFSKGAVLKANEEMAFLGVEKGQEITVQNDGQYLRIGPLTWSAEQLEEEIKNGVWTLERTL